MHPKILLAVFTALLQLTTAQQEVSQLTDASLPVLASADTRCGKDFKNKKCPTSMCCSATGYCGTTIAHCKVPENCQEKYGMCDSKKSPKGLSTSDFPRPFNKEIPDVITACSMPRTLALTFDDGPDNYTTEVLQVLSEYQARATFFLGGIINGRGSIDDEKWAPVVKSMVTAGHQIGSHTWSHPDLDKISTDERREQMYKNERAITNVIGKFPTFMRAPMVRCGKKCRKDMKSLGYHVVDEQFDSGDSRDIKPSTQEQSQNLTRIMNITGENGNMFIIQHDTDFNVAQVTRNILQNMRVTKPDWKAVPLVECLGHNLDDAYTFPEQLVYGGAAEGGCIVAGPGSCIPFTEFYDKTGCLNAADGLSYDADHCHAASENYTNSAASQPREHCAFAHKVTAALYEFCENCGKGTKHQRCDSEDFTYTARRISGSTVSSRFSSWTFVGAVLLTVYWLL